jgi:hypothetical protein
MDPAYGAALLADAVVAATTQRKQELGQALAAHIGFAPGPLGPDGDIDGVVLTEGGDRVHFQSKLSANRVGAAHAAEYYAALMRHGATASVYLAGAGYTGGVRRGFAHRFWQHPHLDALQGHVHLLALQDVFVQSDAYRAALLDLPSLGRLEEIDWAQFR